MKQYRDIYFARCLCPDGRPLGAIKVGCSIEFETRLKAVASNQPYSLELIGTVPGDMVMESIIHLFLKEHRIAGEFFSECEAVVKFVNNAIERGAAFETLIDRGSLISDPKALEAFLRYHGISIEQVCNFLGVPLKKYKDKLHGTKNRRVLAAAMLIVRSKCKYAIWPDDALRGLLGKTGPDVPKTTAPLIVHHEKADA